MLGLDRFGGAALLCSASILSGCNAIGRVAAGPVVPVHEKKPYVGGEATASLDIDVTAGSEWLSGKPQPERASRFGVTEAAYVRGTSLGFGTGMRGGLFVAGTDGNSILMASALAEAGVETLDKPYGSIGGVLDFTAGFTIRKTYDPKARWLCRSLTYLTFTLEGAVTSLPASDAPGIARVALLVGIAGLDDGGSPSERSSNPSARCPR